MLTLDLKGEILSFKMTNKTILDIDAKYENFGLVINGVMYGKELYNNSLRVLECSCISERKEPLTIEELVDKLEPQQLTQEVVTLATEIYYEYIGIKKIDEEQEHEEKEIKKK
ncbi:hypothetical protein [Clostridium thermobutyricum]|uniref:Uncharacterized protein n=1 Tax=Clostridium thermobutyricum DSM 4928 TaxID=1121339 RepID=A0A1V4SV95_9CLOT|nr:hypothetical protein [Clostridium thermobutyricum]OPX47899.1 hypothetical protein CLTHE_14700 [Clostridium thermobutyricum DSM 4928]